MADFLLHIIPATFFSAFTEGDLLQVLLVAVLFGFALHPAWASSGGAHPEVLDALSVLVFNVLGFIMKLAPLGAFGAMAFTIGKYGVGGLGNLGL